MKVLITGATGFVGGHLIEFLAARGETEIHGLSRHGRWSDAWQHLDPLAHLHAGDLLRTERVQELLEQIRPDRIVHLAGFAHAGRSFHESEAAWAANFQATRSLYEAIGRSGQNPRVLFVSSGLVYGEADAEVGLSETAELRPASPYAASKAAADLLSYQQTCHPGLDVVRVRPFNQIGPRQSTEYALARFAAAIAAAERGTMPPILETGDLSASRDLTDVRDMVEAYWQLLEHGQSGAVYNAGCGQALRIGDVLDRLLRLARVRLEVRSNANARSVDTNRSWADARRLRETTGWRPRYDLDTTLHDTLQYWRERR